MIKLKHSILVAAIMMSSTAFGERIITVCADDDLSPLSSAAEPGYENSLAELIGVELQAKIEYAWTPHLRGGMLRRLKNEECDLVMGIPAEFEGIATSTPYLRTSFVVVSRQASTGVWSDLDDPAWQNARIGVEALGREGSNPPIVTSLLKRGRQEHLVAFNTQDLAEGTSLHEAMVEALIAGSIDVIVTWGPFGGAMVKQHPDILRLSPLEEDRLHPELRFVFPISIGMRAHDSALKHDVDEVLARRELQIVGLLNDYGIPFVPQHFKSIH